MAFRVIHYYFDVILSVTGCWITQDSIKLFLGSFLTSATSERPGVLWHADKHSLLC